MARDSEVSRIYLMPNGKPWPTRKGKRSPNSPHCPATWDDGARVCRNYPGEGTVHSGLGYCRGHSSAFMEELWSEAMDVARELNINPWDALLKSVRVAAGRAAWVDAQLADAVRRNDGEPGNPEVKSWLRESRDERLIMSRVAKAALDAGVAERLVRQTELEGEIVAEVIGRVLDKLGLPPEQRVLAFDEAHRQLLALETPSGAPTTVEGEWKPFGDNDDPGTARGGREGD